MNAFDVPECITQVYADEDGKRWWRYCLTCDNGSNKYGKHRRGHKSEADARMSARDHACQMRHNRIARQIYEAWRLSLVLAPTWEDFIAIWCSRYPHRPGHPYVKNDESEEIMAEIQRRYQETIDREAEAHA